MFIEGFGISSYRSFGNKIQLIGPCNKINFFIGQNNSGKSNILRFLEEKYAVALSSIGDSHRKFNFSELDKHLGQNTGHIQIAFGYKHGGAIYKKVLESREKLSNDGRTLALIKRLLHFPEITHNSNMAWFVYEAINSRSLNLSNELVRKLVENRIRGRHSSADGLTAEEWRNLLYILADRNTANLTLEMVKEAIPYILYALSPVQFKVPQIAIIQAIREIKSDPSREDYDYNGVNIIRELKKLERPDTGPDYTKSKERFDTINKFVRSIVGQNVAHLEIPASEKTIQVEMDGKTLPLENLGTGIHEVIILAIMGTLLQNQVVCIEEPEIHLHPLLQKKLVQYLAEHTSNQYFIATHSASMIDIPDAAVFHVRHNGQHSIVTQALSPGERFSICVDMGYRASDILQANCIIWVEGPSDRIYLKHWLKKFDPELAEGTHYSIMFYGGRLLSNLSADDEEVDEFISLRKINQNLTILIDSDRRKKGQAMNETKRRIRDEFDNGPGFAWITAGREIENYVPSSLMEKAVKGIYRNASSLVSTERYDRCYDFKDGNGKTVNSIDKVKLAKYICQADAELNVFDLQDKIRQMAQFIRNCNDLSTE